MYDVGDVVPLRIEVRNDSGDLVNVGSMDVTITLPDGTTESEIPDNSTAGVYTVDYATTQAGRHLARFVGTGVNAMAQVRMFDVRSGDWPVLVSLEDTKLQLNISADYTDHDEELRRYMEAATGVIEGYVGAVTRRTVTQKASGNRVGIVLHDRPVMSVTSVEEDGVALDSASWRLSDAGVLTRRNGGSERNWDGDVEVEYVAGRAVVPAHFTLAALIVIQHMWETQRGSHGTPRFGGGTQSSAYGGIGSPLLERATFYAITRRVIELLENDMHPGGIA